LVLHANDCQICSRGGGEKATCRKGWLIGGAGEAQRVTGGGNDNEGMVEEEGWRRRKKLGNK
jgi:hypothetical protein